MIRKLKSSLLVWNTLWTFLGQGSRVAIQAIYFTIIARSLGSDGYGEFVAAVALVAILSPFSSLGFGNLLIMNVARDQKVFRFYWGNALVVTCVSGSLLMLLTLLISSYLLHLPFLLLFLVALSDLLFAKVLDVSGQAFQAYERMGRQAQLQVLFSGARLCAAIGLVFFGSPSPLHWGWFYLYSTAFSSGVAVVLVCRELGTPRIDLRRIFSELKEGIYFSISLSSQNIYNEIDKTLLKHISSNAAAGIYAAAYRIIEVSFTPIRSLVYASYAKFFQYGENGIKGSFIFAKRLLPVACGYGVLAGTALYLSAPLVPYLLGQSYLLSVDAIRWLAFLPLLKCMNYFAANTLTGSNHQGLRSAIQVVVAVLSVGFNLLLIPVYSWQGAALAALISDTLLSIGLWGAIWYLYRKAVSHDRVSYADQIGGRS